MLISASVSAARRLPAWLAILGLAWSLGACRTSSEEGQSLTDTYRQAVASPIRTTEDREADGRRKPMAFLEFTKVAPGMRVLDVSAGGGYTTQLLALVVGKRGTVWAQVPEMRPALQERLAKIPQANIVPVVLPFEDPVPKEATRLDLITLIWNYHDIAYLPVDRAKMNKKLFDALKPGGHLVLIDHSARAGSGTEAAKPLHRIDMAVVVTELQQAGFRLEAESKEFRHAADTREEVSYSMKAPVDNFALRFVKPE